MPSYLNRPGFAHKGLTGLGLALVFTLIFSLSLPVMARAASDLPDGFIALSETRLTWEDAKAFCEQKGGKLPLVSGDRDSDPPLRIEGFGRENAIAPKGLPEGLYWTGSEIGKLPNFAWLVDTRNNLNLTFGQEKDNERNVVCVP